MASGSIYKEQESSVNQKPLHIHVLQFEALRSVEYLIKLLIPRQMIRFDELFVILWNIAGEISTQAYQ